MKTVNTFNKITSRIAFGIGIANACLMPIESNAMDQNSGVCPTADETIGFFNGLPDYIQSDPMKKSRGIFTFYSDATKGKWELSVSARDYFFDNSDRLKGQADARGVDIFEKVDPSKDITTSNCCYMTKEWGNPNPMRFCLQKKQGPSMDTKMTEMHKEAKEAAKAAVSTEPNSVEEELR